MKRSLSVHPPRKITFDEYVIRQYVVDDAQAIVDAVTESRDHLQPWMPWMQYEPQDVHARQDLIREWNNLWDKGEEFPYGIFRGNTLVGSTGFHLRGPGGTLDIGYWLHANEVGKRIISRSVRALLDVGFSVPEIHSVNICHDSANHSSRRIPERLHFLLVETSRREKEAPAEEGILMRWEMSKDRFTTLGQ